MKQTIMHDTLLFGNPESEVGIVTLWTKKEHIADVVDKNYYCILGNLFSRSEGISTIIRNCLKNKHIRYVIVCGVDLNQSGDALLALHNNGVNEDHEIIGFKNSIIDKNLPIDAINRFREHVTIIDCRDKPQNQLQEVIQNLDKKGSWGEPEEFPYEHTIPESFPTDVSGFKVKGYDLETIKKRALYILNRFSVHRGNKKELFNMMMVLFPEKERSYENSRYEFDDCEVKAPEDEKVEIIETDHELYVISHCSQLNVEDELELRMRSLHAIALLIANQKQKELKSITMSADHAFVDDDNQTDIHTSLKEEVSPLQRIGDPRGNIIITLENEQIKVTHLDVHGNVLDVFFGSSAEELYKKMAREQTISELSHAFDIGAELQKAEIALHQNLKYVQDKTLDFNKKN